MHRRKILSLFATAPLAACVARPLQAVPFGLSRNGIGLQLWTVRNQMAQDSKATLQAIADAGYKQVELMSVVDSSDLVKQAKDLGLEVRSGFFNWETIANPSNPSAPSVEKVIDVARSFDLEYLVFGYIGKPHRDTADKLKTICETANKAAEKIKRGGLKMSYHNHSFEFQKLDGDQTGFEIMMERFDEDLVNFELDVFWAAIGGCDPIATLKRLGKRVGQIHLKDLKANSGIIYDEGKVPADAFQEVGDGVIDFEQVMQVALDNGVTQFHVEQDESPDPIASIGQSRRFVSTIW